MSAVLGRVLAGVSLGESGRIPKDPMECYIWWKRETHEGEGDRDLDHNLITSPLAFQRPLLRLSRSPIAVVSPEMLSHPPLSEEAPSSNPIGHGAFVDPHILGGELGRSVLI